MRRVRFTQQSRLHSLSWWTTASCDVLLFFPICLSKMRIQRLWVAQWLLSWQSQALTPSLGLLSGLLWHLRPSGQPGPPITHKAQTLQQCLRRIGTAQSAGFSDAFSMGIKERLKQVCQFSMSSLWNKFQSFYERWWQWRPLFPQVVRKLMLQPCLAFLQKTFGHMHCELQTPGWVNSRDWIKRDVKSWGQTKKSSILMGKIFFLCQNPWWHNFLNFKNLSMKGIKSVEEKTIFFYHIYTEHSCLICIYTLISGMAGMRQMCNKILIHIYWMTEWMNMSFNLGPRNYDSRNNIITSSDYLSLWLLLENATK